MTVINSFKVALEIKKKTVNKTTYKDYTIRINTFLRYLKSDKLKKFKP